jgi:ferredoxin
MARRDTRTVLRINPITCDGHGLCAELLPELLAMDDWGYPMPITVEVPPELDGHASRAAAACPTLAIILDKHRR